MALLTNNNRAQVSVSEQEWVIPTYPVAPPDKNPMFFNNESYQGASRIIYSYALNDIISTRKSGLLRWETDLLGGGASLKGDC